MIHTGPEPSIEIPDTDITSFVLDRSRGARRKAGAHRRADRGGPSPTGSCSARECAALAGGLAARGIGKGDVVACTCRTCPRTPWSSTASPGGRRTYTTVNPLYTANELAHQLTRLRGEVLVTVAPSSRPPARRRRRPALEQVFVVGEAEGRDYVPTCSATRATHPRSRSIRPRPRRHPLLVGHDGAAKGVMLTHRNLVANTDRSRTSSRSSADDDVLIGCLPFFHIYGMTVIMNMGLPARRS